MPDEFFDSFAVAAAIGTLLFVAGEGWLRLATFLAGTAAPLFFILDGRARSKSQMTAALIFVPASALIAASRGWRLFLTYLAGACTMAGVHLLLHPKRAERK
jgi:hypothetical protein